LFSNIFARFATPEDLQEFSDLIGIQLDKGIKRVWIKSRLTKKKRIIKKKDIPIKGWVRHWCGMPEFIQDRSEPYAKIELMIETEETLNDLKERIGQKLTPRTKSIWHPRLVRGKDSNKRYIADSANPEYPVYIISKGRWDKCITSRSLDLMGVSHKVVVEPTEYDKYAKYVDKDKLLVLPFSDLGKGSIPARNWVWEHSISEGCDKHWILDDNIEEFVRLNRNVKISVRTGAIFRATEDFVDRYENVAISGLQYRSFARADLEWPAFSLNTRVYSCLLIRNDIPYRWRGRYNEDTDLSLRVLKDGWCTILMNAFLAGKVTTMRMTGGNTDRLYQEDGRLKMAQSLVDQHPDVVTITHKWGRPQHQVDYRPFKKNKLKFRKRFALPKGVDEYGMEIVEYTLEELAELENKKALLYLNS
jgi:hypothetical protein